jgi:filamentous hemagglutinin family protein
MSAYAAAPPAPNVLPTGGKVVSGAATISEAGTPGAPVLNVDQSTQRGIIDWGTFNLGSGSQVNFIQPGSSSATLNRVLDTNPSQILGKITATGQLFLTNPNGVYFAKSASVDVGSLTATTHGIGDADFMAGNITLSRNGASGSVVNEGELRAAIGGYIALLAPEVRNSGVVIAKMGTVAMASGESFTLSFENNHLAGITVRPSTIAALVENKGAVLAPGGLIILSAKALDRLQGGIVNNSGTLEATGLSEKGGRVLLEASDGVDSSGTINANAGSNGSAAGSVEITAPEITNTGSISATGARPGAEGTVNAEAVAGGAIVLNAHSITQTASGTLDASGSSGGSVKLHATQDISLAGAVVAQATRNVANDTVDTSDPVIRTKDQGGSVSLIADHNVTLHGASVDVSGKAGAGEILVQGGRVAIAPAGIADPATVALFGTTQLRASSLGGKGGNITLTGDRVGLLGATSVDVTGARGGGDVFLGGGFHGQDASIANAQQVDVAATATIDASAGQTGNGGKVAIWSDGQTLFSGLVVARGGAVSGAGGFVEVSGKGSLGFHGLVDASARHGMTGTLLLDPHNITVDTVGSDPLSAATAFATTPATDSIIAPATITAVTNTGTAVTLQANNDLIINSSIITVNGGNGGALTFQAGRSITVNASVTSDNGAINFIANDPGAVGTNRDPGAAVFTNNGAIDAGSGSVFITMGTFAGTSGSVSSGHIAAANLTITQAGPTSGTIAGAIDLGQTDLTSNLVIGASSDRNVTNTLGTSGMGGNVVVRGLTSIDVGAGSVVINGSHTDFNIIGLTAGDVSLNDTNAVQFATTTLSGNLSETSIGPIASTGPIQVAGTAAFTANNGGFGYADPYIALTNPANHFGGALTLSVLTTGATGTGGYATIRDSGAVNVASAGTATYLQLQAGAAVTTGTLTIGSSLTVTSASGAVGMATTTAGQSITVTGAGPLSLGTTSAGGSIALTGAGTADLGTTNAGQSLSVSTTGAVDLGTTTVATNLTVSTTAAITDSGTLTVPQQTVLTAGLTNDITLDSPNNDFSSVRIVSADNATLVDKNAINFGSYSSLGGYASHIAGALNVKAGGDISQSQFSGSDGYSAIEVDGAAMFTANASGPISLYLGSDAAFNGTGQANNFVGGVALVSGNGSTGFTNVQLRNVNSTASVLTGLTSVGLLNNVFLRFDNAPSVSLPGMTATGSFSLAAPGVANTATVPGNIISQTGPIVVAGATVVQAASSGDIVLDNAANDFSQFGIISSRNTTVVDVNAVVLNAPGLGQSVSGNLALTTGGRISDAGFGLSVAGTATLNPGLANDISLTQNNTWNIVAIPAANNVTLNPLTGVVLGASTIAGTLSITSHNTGYTLTQVGGSAVNMTTGAVTTFVNFTGGITLSETGNVLGPLTISNGGALDIRENDAITQSSAWTNYNGSGVGYPVTLTTSNDQAIILDQPGNYLGPLTITQVNSGAGSAGAVYVRETADSLNGMTQGGAWCPWHDHARLGR